MIKPLHKLGADVKFWNHTQEGLAVLATAHDLHVMLLQRPVPELAVVADRFHVRPLLRILQSAERYQVLCLTRQTAKLYQGNRDALDPIEVDSFPATMTEALGDEVTEYERTMHSAGAGGGVAIQHGIGAKKDEVTKDTERYFRAVDRAVSDRFSKPSGLPLILVALPEHQPVFRAISQNPALREAGVAANPDVMSVDQLRAAVWHVVEPMYLARLAELSESYRNAAAHQKGTADLSDAARAAVEGRVATLLVEADRIVPGRLDASNGAIASAPLDHPEVGDLLDELAVTVLKTGGEVVIVPKERMPSASGLAATYRF
jgi:hypothetical protein